jgi:GrpB-like predicted nucleotidyltransferase (UPF0157 family)
VDDAKLEAVTVGAPPPQYQDIVIADYDPIWPHWYESAAFRIRAALGDKVLQLDHVGSTSVRGLPAKPLIDINLVVADTTDEDAYVPPLEATATRCASASPTGSSIACCAVTTRP